MEKEKEYHEEWEDLSNDHLKVLSRNSFKCLFISLMNVL